jgi:hypothetical protein
MVNPGEQADAHADRMAPPRAVHHLRRTGPAGAVLLRGGPGRQGPRRVRCAVAVGARDAVAQPPRARGRLVPSVEETVSRRPARVLPRSTADPGAAGPPEAAAPSADLRALRGRARPRLHHPGAGHQWAPTVRCLFGGAPGKERPGVEHSPKRADLGQDRRLTHHARAWVVSQFD